MEWSLSEKIALVTVVLTAAGVVANICVVGNTRLRNAIFIALGMGLCFVAGVIAWPVIWQPREVVITRPAPSPPVNERPTPTPKPSPSPTPAGEAPAEPEGPQGDAVLLYASSMDDQSARSRYCVVGDFSAESRQSARSFDVVLTEANISLCNYSAHGSRRIKIRVGRRSSRPDVISWSRPVTLAESLGPGQTLTLSDPIRFTIPRRGSADLSNGNFVVQLINVPTDTNREMRYYIPGQGGELLAQIDEPR